MNKFICCALLAFICACKQQPKVAKHSGETIQMGEYTVVLLPEPDSTFGYDIFKEDKLITHQETNPITKAPFGLYTKKDAIGLASYAVSELQFNGKIPQQYPPDLIDQLGITMIRPTR